MYYSIIIDYQEFSNIFAIWPSTLHDLISLNIDLKICLRTYVLLIFSDFLHTVRDRESSQLQHFRG